MNILSLFDGISCARVALDRVGIKVDNYYSSEIDRYAITIAQKNYPDMIQLGDIKNIRVYQGSSESGIDIIHIDNGNCSYTDHKIHKIDLMILGSPCQDLSIAKKDRKGLDGERSGLFWEAIRLHKEVKPKWFIYENVNSMKQEWKDQMLKAVQEIDPSAYMIMINAALVSAQNRKRIFITNIPNITQPEDKNIQFWNIMEAGSEQVYQYRRTYWREIKTGKIPTLTANMGTGGNNVPYIVVKEATKKGYAVAFPGNTVDTAFPRSETRRGRVGDKVKNVMTHNTIKVFDGQILRPITEEEIEKCFGLPNGYTVGVPKSHRLKALGNGFCVDVIAHILSFIK